MPEGPSIVILKESVKGFKGKKIAKVDGTAKVLKEKDLVGDKILNFKTFGKHFLICFKGFTIRIHLLMFGYYAINEREEAKPRLSLTLTNGDELNLYACAVSLIEQPLNKVYDWTADVMNKRWDSKQALAKLKENGDSMVCDVLLDQNIFAGVGNIIKNEVLYRVKIHPKSTVKKIPVPKKKQLIRELVNYSYQFLEWKKAFTLKKHWLAHTKKICPRDDVALLKEYFGKTKRRSFYCKICQKLYK